MLKIYGVYKSRATRTLWLANELGLDFEHVPVIQAYKLADPLAPGARLNTRSPEFLAVNPMGTIPAIDDNGLKLHESMAINLYLARKHGGPLAPKDLAEEALMMQWTLFAVCEIEAHALKISMANAEGRLATDAGRAEAEVVSRLLKRPFAVLERHFSENQYAVGGRFTIADLNLAEVVRYGQPYQPLMDEHPNIAAWLTRCQQRPAFQAMWQARLAEQD